MRHTLFLILVLVFPFAASADSRLQKAEDAYSTMQYATAAHILTQVADSLEQAGVTPAADVYYNLGNAHYRQQQYAEASLSYLRALRILPGFEHAAANLQKAQLHLGLQSIENDEMFFVLWFRMLVNAYGVEGWTAFSMAFLLITFVALAGYVLPKRISYRKAGFGMALLALLAAIFSIACAATQRYRYHHNTQAVIFSSEAKVYTSPTPNSKAVTTLREGQIVLVLNDTAEKGWQQIKLPGTDTEGWITAKGFKRVATTKAEAKETKE